MADINILHVHHQKFGVELLNDFLCEENVVHIVVHSTGNVPWIVEHSVICIGVKLVDECLKQIYIALSICYTSRIIRKVQREIAVHESAHVSHHRFFLTGEHMWSSNGVISCRADERCGCNEVSPVGRTIAG